MHGILIHTKKFVNRQRLTRLLRIDENVLMHYSHKPQRFWPDVSADHGSDIHNQRRSGDFHIQ